MKPVSFFQKFILTSLIAGPFLLLVWVITLWVYSETGDGVAREVVALIVSASLGISLAVLGVIIGIRLVLKKPVILLVQVLVWLFVFVPHFMPQAIADRAFTLNVWLHQQDREDIVHRLLNGGETATEKTVMESVNAERGVVFSLVLNKGEKDVVNIMIEDTVRHEYNAQIFVHRECNGELVVEFPIEENLLEENKSVVFSQVPAHAANLAATIENVDTQVMIGTYELIQSIGGEWYYVRSGCGAVDKMFKHMLDLNDGSPCE